MISAAEQLFGRHVNLTPLGQRRRGLVGCAFHPDTHPSCSVDLDKGLFHCFACGKAGGVRKFAELVGEAAPRPAPRTLESPLQQARADIMRTALRQPWARVAVRQIREAGDFIKRARRTAQQIRGMAVWTDEHGGAETWELLARAARMDTAAHAVEIALDELLALDRLELAELEQA